MATHGHGHRVGAGEKGAGLTQQHELDPGLLQGWTDPSAALRVCRKAFTSQQPSENCLLLCRWLKVGRQVAQCPRDSGEKTKGTPGSWELEVEEPPLLLMLPGRELEEMLG